MPGFASDAGYYRPCTMQIAGPGRALFSPTITNSYAYAHAILRTDAILLITFIHHASWWGEAQASIF